LRHTISKYRFVTPHRIGKWYQDLSLARRFASVIGAGFYDNRSGEFVAYPGTRLEVAARSEQSRGAW
jgi:hypothetical protein